MRCFHWDYDRCRAPGKRPGRKVFRRLGLGAALLALWVFAAPLAQAAQRSSGSVAAGTSSETAYYVQQSAAAGPTVMIVGGVHGDEPAGAAAADQIRYWPIVRGKIIVLPKANVLALAAHKRLTPGEKESLANLNRSFSKADELVPPRGRLAEDIWKLLQEQKPDWLVDLHEGGGFHQLNSQSVGSSILGCYTPEVKKAAPVLLQAVNATIDDEKKRFMVLRQPVDTSLARAAGTHLNINTMIVETTIKDQPLSLRTRQHRVLVHGLLTYLQMLGPGVTPDWITNREHPPGCVQVALYDAGGSAGKGVPRLREILSAANLPVTLVGPPEIRSGVLEQFTVAIFAGGTGSGEARALGPAGRQQVQQFVEQGGGYVGICAGAYLATSGYDWSLKILDAKTVSNKWRRGKGTVQVELTPSGREILGDHHGLLDVLYHNGPILMPAGSDRLPAYTPLALFRSELSEGDAPKGIMVNSPAAVAGRCGKGRVLCISPHPEQTEGLDALVLRAIQWAAGKMTKAE